MSIRTNTPHIESAWSESFLLELRLRGVAGNQIGAALAEVEAHCAESGETAYAAFGDPTTYATELALPPSVGRTGSLRAELLSAGLGLAGMLLTLAAVGAWRSGTGVEVTGGSVAVLAILLIGTALIVRYAAPLMRAIATNAWLAIVFAVVPVVVLACVLLLFGQTVLFTLPMAPSLVVGCWPLPPARSCRYDAPTPSKTQSWDRPRPMAPEPSRSPPRWIGSAASSLRGSSRFSPRDGPASAAVLKRAEIGCVRAVSGGLDRAAHDRVLQTFGADELEAGLARTSCGFRCRRRSCSSASRRSRAGSPRPHRRLARRSGRARRPARPSRSRACGNACRRRCR